jgi:hypothetical protein
MGRERWGLAHPSPALEVELGCGDTREGIKLNCIGGHNHVGKKALLSRCYRYKHDKRQLQGLVQAAILYALWVAIPHLASLLGMGWQRPSARWPLCIFILYFNTYKL